MFIERLYGYRLVETCKQEPYSNIKKVNVLSAIDYFQMTKEATSVVKSHHTVILYDLLDNSVLSFRCRPNYWSMQIGLLL